MAKGRILVVDDEKMIRWTLETALEKEGYGVSSVESGERALEHIEASTPDVVLLDITLPGMDGIEILKKIREAEPSIVVIMITAQKDVSVAVSAMKLGAFDYVEKPFDVDRIIILVNNAMERRKLSREVEYYRKEKREKHGFDSIIGKSPQIAKVIEVARRISRSEATTVLLQGESGTGKDILAMAIHYESARATRPFMPINVTALPGELLESELMGYEKGAFTDAKATKKGLFEIASGGTIYLDEIGDMPPGLQVKLLRFIETKTFKRVGGHTDIEVDVRIIAATNKDLEEAVKEGKFREDLFYRLNVIPVYIPPLRERREDIAHLAGHFLAEFGREFKIGPKKFAKGALSSLVAYEWPGNVRELRNVLERALILGTGESVGIEDLAISGSSVMPALEGALIEAPGGAEDDSMPVADYSVDGEMADSGDPTRREAGKEGLLLPEGGIVLEDVEMELIRQALEKTGGNQTRAAKLLGLTRDALRYRMKKFDIL
ncbi:MAG: response regulator [Deltaproteobacteria bacterium]|nr:response regulator [Candidatus Latescibacterota bacterium]NIS77378.1 response regulator [Deltaproteobacteria bacterium]